jgi:hypothetical protein
MPLITRRSSTRSGPGSPVGKCGSIRVHCSSFNQNTPCRIFASVDVLDAANPDS